MVQFLLTSVRMSGPLATSGLNSKASFNKAGSESCIPCLHQLIKWIPSYCKGLTDASCSLIKEQAIPRPGMQNMNGRAQGQMDQALDMPCYAGHEIINHLRGFTAACQRRSCTLSHHKQAELLHAMQNLECRIWNNKARNCMTHDLSTVGRCCCLPRTLPTGSLIDDRQTLPYNLEILKCTFWVDEG